MINDIFQIIGCVGLALSILSCPAGLVLIWIGAAGTRSWQRCLCGYELRGHSGRDLRCPECGRTGPFATIRSPTLLNIGLLLLFLSLAIGGIFVLLSLAALG